MMIQLAPMALIASLRGPKVRNMTAQPAGLGGERAFGLNLCLS
jgi:hypothetical protein